MCMAVAIPTLPLTVQDLCNGAMEKPVFPYRERLKRSMTLPSISPYRRQRLGTWYFSIRPITLVRMLPMWEYMWEIIRCIMQATR